MLRGLKQFNLPELEEKVLEFWKRNDVFKKSVASRQARGRKRFVFFEGPPTANGRPGLHHVLARAFKDVICRFRTMRGFFVLRRAGWDTHGLPVELEIEKKLGLKNKQEIEKFGIAEFNAQAKMSVWTYKSEWEKLTERIGFWLDLNDPYITYDNKYIESLWWVFGEIHRRGFLKKLYKVVPWCPRCQTPLSSHELGQPGAYKLTKDPSVYVKFRVKRQEKGVKKKEYLLVWTTTPWTLSANVAIAVNQQLTYTKYKVGDEYFWSFSPPPKNEGREAQVVEKLSGKKMLGWRYEPLFKLPDTGHQPPSYEIISADFVSTEEGTGLVHIAPAFGEDDLRVAGHGKIPVTIDDRGRVTAQTPGKGKFIKDADADIIKDLDKRGFLYSAGTVEHEYPHCWRCSNPLIYFARESWFIEMSRLREEMLAANKAINWIPEHIKEGRFGEWLRDLKDWSISRNRYWGMPLPIWECPKNEGHRLVVGSLEDLNARAYNQNRFFAIRHGRAEHNLEGILAAGEAEKKGSYRLTKDGTAQVEKSARALKKIGIDVIYASPFKRTQETAGIIAKVTGAKIINDKRLAEMDFGSYNGRKIWDYRKLIPNHLDRFVKAPPGGETFEDVKKRMLEFAREINAKHHKKNILIVSHGDPLWMLEGVIRGFSKEEFISRLDSLSTGEYRELAYNNWPLDDKGELDIHRPFVDEIFLRCSARLPDGRECGGKMSRVKEVADVWFESGAMPFAQWHYPFENKEIIDKKLQFPADYIAEGIDQTRGWFYTLLSVSTLLKKGVSYKNVIALGHLLDRNGQKMSKSKGNVVDPWEMIRKYGADVMRWYFYAVNPPGEPKRFDEQDLSKTFRKLFMLAYNSFVFYSTYGEEKHRPIKILDDWIVARLNETAQIASENLERYEAGEAAKAIEQFVDDLSRWYIRRSRKNVSGKILKLVLTELAKLMAPFSPFFPEALYQSLGGKKSVHLESWPKTRRKATDKQLLAAMTEIRRIASLALAEREKAGIKVRQPLSRLKVKSVKLKASDRELIQLLADEVNVKGVVIDRKLKGELELDVKVTPELKKEGDLRELVRMIQGLRHDAGYNPSHKIALMFDVPAETIRFLKTIEPDLKKMVNAKIVEYKKNKFDAELTTKLGDQPIWVAVRKI